jgi:hypothetical protein
MKHLQPNIENYEKRNFAFLQMAGEGSDDWTGYAKVIEAYGEDEAARILADELKREGCRSVRISGTGRVLEDGTYSGRLWLHPHTLPLDFENMEENGPGSYFRKVPQEEEFCGTAAEMILPNPPPPYEIFWTDGRSDPETEVIDWFPLENNDQGEWNFNSISSARMAASLLLRIPLIESVMIVRDGEAIVTQTKERK